MPTYWDFEKPYFCKLVLLLLNIISWMQFRQRCQKKWRDVEQSCGHVDFNIDWSAKKFPAKVTKSSTESQKKVEYANCFKKRFSNCSTWPSKTIVGSLLKVFGQKAQVFILQVEWWSKNFRSFEGFFFFILFLRTCTR